MPSLNEKHLSSVLLNISLCFLNKVSLHGNNIIWKDSSTVDILKLGSISSFTQALLYNLVQLPTPSESSIPSSKKVLMLPF